MTYSVSVAAGGENVKKESEAVKLVKEALGRKGWNQKELAERTKLSGPTISRCLTGDLLISKDVAERLAEQLGLDKKKLVELAVMDRIQSLREEYEDYPEVQRRLELSLM